MDTTKLDASLIKCRFGTISSGGSVVEGAPGATDHGAVITITGKNDTKTAMADNNGGFVRSFIASSQESVTVTAETSGYAPTNVQVLCIQDK